MRTKESHAAFARLPVLTVTRRRLPGKLRRQGFGRNAGLFACLQRGRHAAQSISHNSRERTLSPRAEALVINMNDNILEVKDLIISFRTNNGNVHAVRDINFELKRGETFAIVGESGSGKSVTSRAILGILAGNAIVEGGSIIYNGQDLLRIPEEEFHRIRGDKIAMIFQDPLSSLNPIVRIGKQLTEAMILKNKASRRRARDEFNRQLRDDMRMSLNEWYDMIGLDQNKLGDVLGWDIDRGYIETCYASRLDDEGQPCLVVNYVEPPHYTGV